MRPEFEAEKHGYNKKQVDAYIDHLCGEYVKVSDLCKQYYERIELLEYLEEYKDSVSRTTITAEKLAIEMEQVMQLFRSFIEAIHLAKTRAEQINAQSRQTHHKIYREMKHIIQLLNAFTRRRSCR